MPQYLTNDELLDVPLGNLQPGELARSFTAHAAHVQKVEEAEAAETLRFHHDAEQHEEQETEEHAELEHRQEVLLTRIAEREDELLVEARREDERAIKLHDGRRAYVDGRDYRDAEGQKLTGADRAEAEIDHLDHPDATTWQEKHALDEQWKATERLRSKVEAVDTGKDSAQQAAVLTAYEKELKADSAGDIASLLAPAPSAARPATFPKL